MVRASMMQLRKHPGELVNLVRIRDELVQLERDGRPVAVLISPERLARLERAASERSGKR